MKTFLALILSLFMTTSVLAVTESLHHRVLDGKYHKDGNLEIKKFEAFNNDFQVNIDYKLKPKGIIGRILKKYMEGSYILSFPVGMIVEQGYYDLQSGGPIDIANEDKVATMKYIKQVDIDGYQGAHKVEIRSKSTMDDDYPEGKWHMFLYYHPGVHSMGIFRTEIYYHGKYSYEVISKLR
ncbi:hypothetical protein [Halobacteriovorax sp. JY17]|uniref:hypothetical protein n=1 Tax=Halobacteriovorax sp. JY17 TaxID=2014617 RepID=UPI000C536AC2|nr:hypothetical protein [Halobacteriovorax sp. JY17]PIK15214.1 MAG: hypothetical protein CES88_00450 [Halobacteriovorax sp. JY17]